MHASSPLDSRLGATGDRERGGGAAAGFTHLTADFIGAAPAQLRDATLISGLLIAAAGAAGLTAIGTPVVRALPGDGIGAILMLADCHMAVHAFPERKLFLLDILTSASHDASKALDVFTRRLPAREVRAEQRPRG
jgi:S-adenosylmethionine/arginine decarboxylase-like enzyme